MKKLDLDTLINKIEDIPTIPSTINNIMTLIEDPNSNPKDIEIEILKDQSITSKVLKLSNSSYYGFSRKITTISDATILLGFKTIKSIVLASGLSKFLVRELPDGYRLDKYELWNQSQTCAVIARYIAKKLKISNPEEAYIAGLIRDIGKIILNQYVAKEYDTIMYKVENEMKTFSQAEKEVLHFSHEEVGAGIAQKWNFPESLVESILYHHHPEKATIAPKLVSLVHIADAITMTLGIGLGSDGLAYTFSPSAISTLNIDNTFIQETIDEISEFINDIESFYDNL